MPFYIRNAARKETKRTINLCRAVYFWRTKKIDDIRNIKEPTVFTDGSFQLQDKFNVLGKCLATWRCTRYNARVIDLERGCEDGTSRRNWQYPYQFGQL